jgi:hypothetical protein
MLIATLVCCDPDCDEEIEISVKRLSQLGDFSCECGFGFVLQSVSELREPDGEVVSIVSRVQRGEQEQSSRAA